MAIISLTSTPGYAEASQIIGTVNSVINQVNSKVSFVASQPTSFRNAIIGGDFFTNPWQRGTSFTSIANTLTYTADRWWAVAQDSGASISVLKQGTTTTNLTGFGASLQIGRADGSTITGTLSVGQCLETIDSLQFAQQPVVLSFYAQAGSGFTGTAGVANALTVAINTGTGTNESAVTFALGSWTGQAAVASQSPTSVTLTTSWQRFTVTGFVPATATQIGVQFSWQPTTATAASSDFFRLAGVQLEVGTGTGVATPFERREISIEQRLSQRFAYVVQEPTGAQPAGGGLSGMSTSTTNAKVVVPFPVPMRVAPTASFPANNVGNWALSLAGGTASLTITSTIQVAGITSAIINAVTQSAIQTVGQAVQVVGAGVATPAGTNIITFSSEL